VALLALIAKLGLDKSGFDAGMDQASKKAASFGSGLKSSLAGAFSVAAVTAFTAGAIEAAEAVGDLSERLGLSLDDAQDFALAAKMGGADVEYLAGKMEKLRAFMAGGGSLSEFGTETTDVVEAVKKLSEIINDTGLSAQQAVTFVEIFGKGSGKLINVLGDLKMAQHAIKFDKESVRNAQIIGDAWAFAKSSAYALAALKARYSPAGIGLGLLFPANKSKTTTDTKGITTAEEAVEAKKKRDKEAEFAAKVHMDIQDKILKLEKETSEIDKKTRFDKLTDAQKLIDLKREEAELQLGLARNFGLDDEVTEKQMEARKRLAEIGAERQDIRKSMVKIHPGVATDEFQKIGAFTNSAGASSQYQVLRQQLSSLDRLRVELTSRGILIRGTD
jgi:hypothetical protein